MTFLALAVAGCATSPPNSGAPSPAYETSTGSGQDSMMNGNPTLQPGYPEGSWQRWRYQGMTPTTP